MRKGLSVSELDALIGDRDHAPFLSTRSVVYRRLGLKQNPPNREDALRLMAENPNLVRRPLTVRDGELVIGFVRDKLSALCEG